MVVVAVPVPLMLRAWPWAGVLNLLVRLVRCVRVGRCRKRATASGRYSLFLDQALMNNAREQC